MLKALLSRPWVWAIILLVVIILLVILFGCETVPKRELTIARMEVIEVRSRTYWKANGNLPARLSNLPILAGRDNATTDAWGREIGYRVTGTTVELSSPGDPRSPSPIALNFDASVSP